MVSINLNDDFELYVKNNHKILSNVSYELNEDAIKLTFESIHNLQEYNIIRQKIFELIIDEFYNPIIERGLKKDSYKILIKNHRNEFNQFLQRKISYFILYLLQTGDLQLPFELYNIELYHEIQYNSKMIAVTSDESRRKFFLKIINDHITLSNKTTLPKKIASFILTKNKLKEKLIEYMNEFLKYLVIF
ncbi:MAG: hypothetical protein FK731_14960 [Asgard group archaeon]|nr:hypothetical protein [Asgard group archaeon]